MTVLFLLVGIPGSGKTTWVQKFLADNPEFTLISTDSIRWELFGSTAVVASNFVHDVAHARADEFLRRGQSVVIDSTNVDTAEWQKYRELCPSYVVFIAKVFKVDPDEAIKRIEKRNRSDNEPTLETLRTMKATLDKNLPLIHTFFDMVLGRAE